MAQRLPAVRGSREGRFMKRFGTALAAVVLVALCVAAGCNDYGNTFQRNTGALLTSLSPSNVTASNFIQNTATSGSSNGSVVQWTSGATQTSLTTTFTSATQLTATVPASLLTTESCANVTVFNPPAVDPNNPGANGGGGTSPLGQTFTVSTNANFCPAASETAQNSVTIAEETPAVSLDGRFVAYTGQQGAHSQIFLRDTCEGAAKDCKPQTRVLSAAQDGTEGNGESHAPSISSDGRYVAFSSAATNLVADTPVGKQIFLRDTCNGADSSCKPQTHLISLDPDGRLSGTDNLLPSISSSGRFIAFLSVTSSKSSNASQANTGQINTGIRQVFVRDTCIGATGSCTPK